MPSMVTDSIHIACASCGTVNRMPAARLEDQPRCGTCRAPLLDGKPAAVADEARFDTLVGRSDLPVLVDFWAAWCGPCRMVAPVLDEIQAANPDKITVLKLNVDENPDLAMKYQITSIPAMKVFNKGQVETTIIGAKPKYAIEQDLDYLALSFVRRPEEVQELREICERKGRPTPIIAKIETPSAVERLDSIVQAADGAMVARGALGVELPPETVPVILLNPMRGR